MKEINDYLSKCDEDLAKSIAYRIYGMPGPLFIENEITPTPGPEPSFNNPFYVENITRETETLMIGSYDMTGDDPASYLEIPVEYSTDGTTWSSLGTTGETPLTKELQPGEKVYLRATTNSWAQINMETGDSLKINSIDGVSKVGGNIMSLLYGSSFTGNEITFPSESNGNFFNLFDGNTNLIDASELILPATTLAEGCYSFMFSGCESLTTAPELPATTLTPGCYSNMFGGCTSLTTAPILPATTLAEECYNGMFEGCTSLYSSPSDVPYLPATTLAENCYGDMYGNIPNLTMHSIRSYNEWCFEHIPTSAGYDRTVHGDIVDLQIQ